MCKYDSRSKTSYYLYESDDDTIEVDSMGMILTEPNCYLHKIEIKVRGKKSVAFDWKAADEAEAKHFAKLKSDWEAAHPGKTAQDPKEVNNG